MLNVVYFKRRSNRAIWTFLTFVTELKLAILTFWTFVKELKWAIWTFWTFVKELLLVIWTFWTFVTELKLVIWTLTETVHVFGTFPFESQQKSYHYRHEFIK